MPSPVIDVKWKEFDDFDLHLALETIRAVLAARGMCIVARNGDIYMVAEHLHPSPSSCYMDYPMTSMTGKIRGRIDASEPSVN